MNFFEDLVVELREENLLESTVIDDRQFEMHAGDELGHGIGPDEAVEPNELFSEKVSAGKVIQNDESQNVGASHDKPVQREFETAMDVVINDGESCEKDAALPALSESQYEKGVYHARVVSEVSGLQMVEHVLTGVEREYMKIVPNTYDDLNAKKALHAFLNVADTRNSEELAASEFTIMQETEAWCTALCERDREIPVSSLRLYCENSRPALSSQALVALTRFYRNLPYSEQVRSKFDFTITRLFSRPTDNEMRVCLFTRERMLNHINTLYREWSSIPLYTADDDESTVQLTVQSFDDLAAEAESAETFDELIMSDFFSRLRLFKESISELFFAPEVTAATIECNIRIGNAYVKLIHHERARMNDASIESKYGDLNEQAVSDAAARTLQLVELLRGRKPIETAKVAAEGEEKKGQPLRSAGNPLPGRKIAGTRDANAERTRRRARTPKVAPEPETFLAQFLKSLRAVNKWLLATSIFIVVSSVSLWMWANYVVEEDTLSNGVLTISVENSFLGEHLKTARISNGTLYGVLLPTWDVLPKEKKQEFLQKVFRNGAGKGYTQVSLLTKDGEPAAFASADRLELMTP